MTSQIWLLVISITTACAIAYWFFAIRLQRTTVQEDSYTRGLEQWLSGDTSAAITSMRNAIDNDPSSIDPYLQLANLLRENGDARRAEILHRGLTVRPGISPHKQFSISLALAQDLIELEKWGEAKELLDSLQRNNPSTPVFWQNRFRQWAGMNEMDSASKTLKTAVKKVSDNHKDTFNNWHELFLLDRAQVANSELNSSFANKLVKPINKESCNYPFKLFIQANAALVDEDFEKCAELSTEGLLNNPNFADLYFPLLEKSLLSSGRYERTIPILESACQNDSVPASIIVALAILYDKTGDRERAVRLLSNKSEDPSYSPVTVSPFLKLLVNDLPKSDFTCVWDNIYLSNDKSVWKCSNCSKLYPIKRWYCATCNNFETVLKSNLPEAGDK
jgi:lipopolysaccharide biosynthesis regulator YciM